VHACAPSRPTRVRTRSPSPSAAGHLRIAPAAGDGLAGAEPRGRAGCLPWQRSDPLARRGDLARRGPCSRGEFVLSSSFWQSPRHQDGSLGGFKIAFTGTARVAPFLGGFYKGVFGAGEAGCCCSATGTSQAGARRPLLAQPRGTHAWGGPRTLQPMPGGVPGPCSPCLGGSQDPVPAPGRLQGGVSYSQQRVPAPGSTVGGCCPTKQPLAPWWPVHGAVEQHGGRLVPGGLAPAPGSHAKDALVLPLGRGNAVWCRLGVRARPGSRRVREG